MIDESRILSRIESDKNIKVVNKTGNVIYEYGRTQKMQTEPEMSPEIKAPTQMIGQKPKRKLRLKIRRKIEKDNIQEIVDSPEWQKLREDLVGTWKENPSGNVTKLREFLGPVRDASDRKLRIIQNYLTGSGFRIGVISHPSITELLNAVRNEVERRRKENDISKGGPGSGRYPKGSEGNKTSTNSTPSKQNLIDIAPYEGKDGEYVPLTADQNKYKEYITVVQQMEDIANAIQSGSENKNNLQVHLLKLNIERSKLHNDIVEEAVERLSKENPKIPKSEIESRIRTGIRDASDRYITHTRARDLGNQ